VAVEKLLPAELAKIKLRQDALQTTFAVFLDIFYPPIFRRFEEHGLFQQPRLITTFQLSNDPSMWSILDRRMFSSEPSMSIHTFYSYF